MMLDKEEIDKDILNTRGGVLNYEAKFAIHFIEVGGMEYVWQIIPFHESGHFAISTAIFIDAPIVIVKRTMSLSREERHRIVIQLIEERKINE